jgi:hypothetical protein
MRGVLLHYHFLKNAGMTVLSFLMRSFGEGCAQMETPDRDGHVGPAGLIALLERNPAVKAVSSHQIRYPVPAVPGYIFFDLCFLRDPIDRLRSMYYYFRAKPQPGDPVSDFACGSGMGGFVAQIVREMPWYVNDPQVNLIANGIANDVPTEADLERALARILSTSFLGVVDMYTESLVAGQYFLNPVFPELDCAEPPANVSRGMESTLDARVAEVEAACDPAVWAELLRLNRMDLELVAAARAEVSRRLRLVPPDAAARLTSLLASAAP